MKPNWPIMPLDQWREIIGFNPWHFWGLADASIVPVTSKCNDVVREYGWQGADEAGREDIRSAISTAEQIIRDNLAYWPAPVYSELIVPWPRFLNMRLMRMGRRDAMGGWIPVILDEGQIQNIGIESLTLLAGASAVTYADHDGDGLKEDWSVTLASAVYPSEIAVYFTAADRLISDAALSSRWRIEPVSIVQSGGNIVISGKRWLVVKPALYEDKNNFPIDPTVDANFVTTLDVYRRYTKTDGVDSRTDSQSAMIWESKPCPWGCDNPYPLNSGDPYSQGWVAGRAGIRDAAAGIVVPAEAVYNATTGAWSHPSLCLSSCGEPDRVMVRFLGGYPLEAHGWMDKFMRTLVTRLSASEMTRRICACDQANREWSHWQQDVSRSEGPETYQINLDVLSNPIGTRRGQIFAWQQFKGLTRVTGMLV